MIFVSAIPAYAASSLTLVTDVLAAAGIMQGDENGNLNLSSNVTRAEFAKMAVASSEHKDDLLTSTSSLFSDVSYKYWAAPYIKAAASAGYMSGYTDGSFRPSNAITMQETLSVVLRLLGYTSADYTEPFPSGALSLAHKLGLDDGVNAFGAQSMTRRDCAYLFYNLLNTRTKTGAVYCTTLGYATGSDGRISYTALMDAAMTGPIVVTDGTWKNSIKNANGAVVYRNSEKASLSDISMYDVVYYSNSPSVIWAYSSKASGTVEAVLPNRVSPQSVTVAGKVYALDPSTDAATMFSMYGSFKPGDSVTLLLGKDGSAVYAVSTDAAASDIYGVILSTGKTTLTDSSGYEYQADSVTIAATDGDIYTYPVKTNLEEGTIVSVSFDTSGARVSSASSVKISGTVNSAATSLGNYIFADDVHIIDYNENGVCSVTPGRLSGVEIGTAMIKFAALDENKRITDLILNDVTGDMYSYGILIDIDITYVNDSGRLVTESRYTTSSRPASSSPSGIVYNYVMEGVYGSGTNQNKVFSVSSGGVQAKLVGMGISAMSSLQRTAVSDVLDGAVKGSGGTFKTGTNLQVYELKNGTYYQSSLEIVKDLSKYTLTGYYDKTDAKGGRLRVIVATAK